MKKIILSSIWLLFGAIAISGQTSITIYHETFGTGGTNGVSLASSTTYSETSLTYSGSGDVRTSTPSAVADYGLASGGNNVMINSNGENLFMSGLNLTNYTNLNLSFGLRKSITAESGSTFSIAYSSNGTAGPFTTLPAISLPTGSGTAKYHWVSLISLPSNINTLRFQSSSSAVEFRVDDILITGDAAVIAPCSVATNALTPAVNNCISGAASLSWANASCFDEYLVLAKPGTSSAVPTGDGTLYTANSAYGSGSAFDGGFIVYKGAGTSVNITGLTNGLNYTYSIFTRKGTTWSSGVTVNCTPTLGPCINESLQSSSAPAGWMYTGVNFTANYADYTSNNGSIVTTAVSYPTQLTFDLARTNNSSAKTFNVKISTTSPTSGFVTESVFTHSNTVNNGTTPVTIDLSAYSTFPNVYIQFEKVSGTASPWRLSNVVVNCTTAPPACTAPTLLQFSTNSFAPVEQAIIPAFTVNLACITGLNNTCNDGTITLTTNGCGTSGTFTKSVVNGAATFNDISFLRSVQTGITFTATYSGTCAGSISATSAPFNIASPPSTPTYNTIKDENFSAATPIPWAFAMSAPIVYGSGGSNGSDVSGVITNGGNSYLRKSYSINNASGERGTTVTFTFDNVILNPLYNHVFDFKVASVDAAGGMSAGTGVDITEDLIFEISLDGGSTWNTTFTHIGGADKVFNFSSTPLTTINYNSNASYSASSTNSSFRINVPFGSSQFMFRFTASSNRTNENWAVDDLKLQEEIPSITPNYLPDLNLATPVIVCPGSAFVPSFTLTNTVGTSSYSWFANTDISNTSIANPSIIPSASNQTYTLLVTDADNCKDSSTVTVHFPSGNLGEWIGTVSTDWFNCLNWGSGRVPDSTVDVLIDGTMALRDCEISNLSTLSPIPSEAFAKSISLDNAADLSILSSVPSATKLRVANDVLIDNNAQFLAHGSSLISVGGDWFDLTGNLNSSDNGIYIFNGSTQQEISGISPLFFNRIKFYNPVNVKLNPEVISLDVEYAGYTTDGMLTVGNASNAGVLTHSLGGHNGIIRSHTFGVSPILNRLFPIVNPAKELRFAEIDIVPTATYSYLDIGYIETPMGNLGLTIPSANTGGFAFDISDSENDGYWNVEKDALLSPINTSNYSIKLTAENYSNISSMANVSMVKRDNTLSNWQAPGTHIAGTLMGNMASISRSGLVGFSDFGFGYNVTPLPVSLGSFDINCEDGYASVKWTTLQESNSDYFEIQASQNGTDYLSLAHIPAAGNSNTLLPYSYVYLNRENYAYWRLKQVDFNADYELFAPKYATCSEENIEFSVLQQNGNLVLVGPENKQVLWSIYSLDGKLVFTQKANGTYVHTTWAQYATGIYVLKAQSNLEEEVFKIFKP